VKAAVLLLAAGALRHYAWALAPVSAQPAISKALGSGLALVLLWLLWDTSKSRALLPVALWLAWEETQTLLCSVAYAITPWSIEPGQSICAAWIGFDIGAAGLVCIAALTWCAPVKSDR
jgi:hypothetical protein